MMNEPLVSVIMPTFNDSRFVATAIASVLQQTYQHWELVVVNDGSTDDSLQVIEKFHHDGRLKIINQRTNLGVSAARNAGLNVAQGEYIAFIDADDIWYRDKLEREVTLMEREQLPLVYSYYRIANEEGDVLRAITGLPSRVSYNDLLRSNSIPILTAIVKTEVLRGRQFKQVHHEDYALWLDLLRSRKITATLLPAVTAVYRVHKHSISGNKVKSAMWTWQLLRRQEKLTIMQTCKNMVYYAISGLAKHQNVV
ncbi:glycosyltransferase family 2 protein [Levilactobacillus tujiorum]|uniref:Glycosyltransferase family 2 protein n=1 Tax=Levilactobacillus tujiorum TaxID=2912243 RepID=A0ABX1L3Z8_9LACO|nr:glycosyltransferase family 2 protein [Levilactobacillus tujiorum]MCH5463838.1 glycosyltransferase [Levilactobacillus tujiorum]NLR11045.1 glycosyltransferase family 2 protein [Lactobacillus sp. HBUAS51387]NLR28757.1 glycosyltransferase family 2 protein [Levilactobacillus tujiorum]